MGYFINEIAKEKNAPARFSLSNNPNFLELESISSEKKPVEISLTVKSNGYMHLEHMDWFNYTGFIITDSKGNQHIFEANEDMDKVNEYDYMYYLGDINSPDWKKSIPAYNLMKALKKNNFLNDNFTIDLPPVMNDEGKAEIGNTIRIKSKGYGTYYNLTISSFRYSYALLEEYLNIEISPSDTTDEDSIRNGKDSIELQLDVYRDTGIFPGTDDFEKTGTYTTTLSKSYFGEPVWFDVNSMWTNGSKYSDDFLNAAGWTSPETVTDFRITGKRFDGTNDDIFYYSDVLYAITGYGRNLEKNDMSGYVYDTVLNNEIKPLTKQSELTYIKGQSQYFNFILSDPLRYDDSVKDNLGIIYKMYTQSGSFLGSRTMHLQSLKKFCIVNTIKLDIDAMLEKYPQVGIVKAYLCREKDIVSQPLSFHILPDCLYKVNDFAFLNSLGGWSSFNFGGTAQTDFKSQMVNFYKTQTPDFNISSRIESVFNKEVTEQFTVQTLPINAEIADWLKELSASVAVYELSTKRYIIVDELNVKHNTKDDLFSLQMKYHYSDLYN